MVLENITVLFKRPVLVVTITAVNLPGFLTNIHWCDSSCSVAGSAPAQSGRCRCSARLLVTLVFLLVMSDTVLLAHSPPEPPAVCRVKQRRYETEHQFPASSCERITSCETFSDPISSPDVHFLRYQRHTRSEDHTTETNVTETIYQHADTQTIEYIY